MATKGPEFRLSTEVLLADLDHTMLASKNFDQEYKFKNFNLQSLGKEISVGSLHPLMKVRTEFRAILLELG